MSRAALAVKLGDGSIRYGIYNGTVDVVWPPLFDTVDEAWDAWNAYYGGSWVTPNLGEAPEQEAIIYSDYGGGFWWPGRATRTKVIGPREWDEFTDIDTPGQPEWLTWTANEFGREGSRDR